MSPEEIYKAHINESHAAALQAVYSYGYAQAQEDAAQTVQNAAEQASEAPTQAPPAPVEVPPVVVVAAAPKGK
jgi:hypothetical protein